MPLALYCDGLSGRAAAGRAVSAVVDTPEATVGSLRGVLVGSVAATALLLAGSVMLALAFGIFVVGLLLLPVVLVLWVGAAFCMAFAHVRYRLESCASYA